MHHWPPTQQVYCFGLPDMLGAEMASSRMRVCVAFYSQLAVFVAAPTIFRTLLHNWPGVVACGMALATALVWWLGVFRDHQKDDLKYLQGHISVVAEQLVKVQPDLEQFTSGLQLLEERTRDGLQQRGSAQQIADAELEVYAVANRVREKADGICSQLQGMLDEMKEREARLCELFKGLAVDV